MACPPPRATTTTAAHANGHAPLAIPSPPRSSTSRYATSSLLALEEALAERWPRATKFWDAVTLDAVVASVIHGFLLGLSIALLVFQSHYADSVWTDVVAESPLHQDTQRFAHGLLVAGLVTLVAAVIGALATWRRRRLCLGAHAGAVVVVFVAFVCLSVWSFDVVRTTSDWTGRPPETRDASEPRIERRFNTLYCEAQVKYFCDQATLNQLIQGGFGRAIIANQSHSEVSAAAQDECLIRFGRSASDVPPAWLRVCQYCAKAPLRNVDTVVDWAQRQCGFRSSTLGWCERVQPDADGTPGTAPSPNVSPYGLCRRDLFHAATKWGRIMGIIFIVTCVLLVGLLGVVYRMYRTVGNGSGRPTDMVGAEGLDGVFTPR